MNKEYIYTTTLTTDLKIINDRDIVTKEEFDKYHNLIIYYAHTENDTYENAWHYSELNKITKKKSGDRCIKYLCDQDDLKETKLKHTLALLLDEQERKSDTFNHHCLKIDSLGAEIRQIVQMVKELNESNEEN